MMPDVAPAVAIDVLLLVQVPPAVASVSVMALPAATVVGPLIGAGAAETVTDAVT